MEYVHYRQHNNSMRGPEHIREDHLTTSPLLGPDRCRFSM